MAVLSYRMTPTAAKFHNDNRSIRAVMGPPGSGKSAMNVMEIMFRAMRQTPTVDGRRLFKVAVIRSTYPALRTTTLETVRAWLPSEYGMIKETAPMSGYYEIPLADGTRVCLSLTFLAIEGEQDLNKLDSLEYTMAWINEAGEVAEAVFDKCIERKGRYPSAKDVNGGASWSGVIIDYNPPPEGHWLCSYFEDNKNPNGAILFKQPAAVLEHVHPDTGEIEYSLNPDAENLAHLPSDYYSDMLDNLWAKGAVDKIRTRLMMQYGSDFAGKPIWDNFIYAEHVSEEPLRTKFGTPVVLGIDTSGVHPCAIFCQYVNRRWEVQHGAYGENMGREEFFDTVLMPILATEYSQCRALAICDPSDPKDSHLAVSTTKWLTTAGLQAVRAPTNKFPARREAVATLFQKRDGIIISCALKELIDACAGAYKYAESKVSGTMGAVYQSRPNKESLRPYSDWADALQYFALHAVGESARSEVADIVQQLNSAPRKRRLV